MSEEDNNLRNQIMTKFKYKQLKRSKLREFMRKAREDIILDRDLEEQETSVTQRISDNEMVNSFKADYMKFFKETLTTGQSTNGMEG